MPDNLYKCLLPAMLLLLAACSDRGQVHVEHAWMSVPAEGVETTGFLEVMNPGAEAVEIVSASSEAFETVTFHLREGDHFRPAQSLTVPARGRLELDGDNGRLGLAGPQQGIKDGDHLPLALAVRLHNGQLMTLEAELHVHEGEAEHDPEHGHEDH